MKNIFLLYVPPGNPEAVVHYEDTIKKRVDPERIRRFIHPSLIRELDSIFQGRPIAVWGSRDTAHNRGKFERMKAGDEILIVEGDTIKLLGKIAAKTVNPAMSRELWKNIRCDTTEGWDLIYFIANPLEIELPFVEFCRLFGYAENLRLRGFSSVAPDRLQAFYDRYDDLYSVLLLIKQNRPIYEKPTGETLDAGDDQVGDGRRLLQQEDIDAALTPEVLSDHVRMQWKLIGLGLKCGSKVWVPSSDQKKIREHYEFDRFEENFAAGLDTQTRYVENIDVVWKEEFRIDAAFEIENSTTIYSDLLRFADLSLVAPNSTYPLFIVAPREKRNRLIEQLKRPVFRQMRLSCKVRYLSYEMVDEIDRFASNIETGLRPELIAAKAEAMCLDK